jgi:hypothetical protein
MSEQVSQLEVNKTVRILSGKNLKYTIRILFRDGTEWECQSNDKPRLDYSSESRSCLIRDGYDSPICAWDNVAVMKVEENT